MSLKDTFNDRSDPKPMGGTDQFFWYVRRGNAGEVRAFLKEKPQAAKWQKKKETALHVAARGGNADIIETLIGAGAVIDAPDEYGQTPLMHAARHNQTRSIDILLAHRAKIDAQDNSKTTALMHAAFATDDSACDALAMLIERKARLDLADKGENTALHLAAELDNPKSVDMLVAAGACMEARNFDGYTPFLSACRYNAPGAALALIAAGADTDAEDDAGTTGLGLVRELYAEMPDFASGLEDAIEALAAKKHADIRNANAAGTTRQIRKRTPIRFGDK